MFIFPPYGAIGISVSNYEITDMPIANILSLRLERERRRATDQPLSRADKKSLIYPLAAKIPGREEAMRFSPVSRNNLQNNIPPNYGVIFRLRGN